MNKSLRFLFLLSGVICFSLFASAQTLKSFTHDSLQFQEELLGIMDYPAKKQESKEFAEKFPKFWLSPDINNAQRQNIYEICDQFLVKKARPFPDFYNYFNTLFLFHDQQRASSDYTNWEKGLLQAVNNKKSRLSDISDFLIQTQNLLRDSVIYESFATKWECKKSKFKYLFNQDLYIEFEQADLYCYAQRDSCCIFKTSGTYYPFEKIWKGKSGVITWERAGKKADHEFASFNSYSINTKESSFDIDTVSYFNQDLFPGKIKGKLTEKVNSVKKPTDAIYPKFESFEKEIQIDKLFENVAYKGGVAIHGAKFIGKGSPENPSTIFISRNDTLFLTATSEHFAFQDNRIAGDNAEIEIMVDTCKIYHPGLLFKYFPDKKEVNLIRDSEGMAMSPFFNSYHNLIMDFGMLIWKLDENMMHFGSMKGGTKRQAQFESMNFFSINRYMRIQGMDEQNPLVLLRKFADYQYIETFSVPDYANYIRQSVNQVRQQLIGLSFQGFVSYNRNTDEVTLLKRLTDYIKSGMGKQDYDVIRFSTQTENNEDDATFFLGNYDLHINGVKQIAVSDSQNVVIFPSNRKIILKKNRDFEFNGKLMAGLLDMYGKNLSFSYQDFKIDLNQIDSLQINVVEDSLSGYGKRFTRQIGNVLEKISGNLLIDDPNNKSGIQNFPEYPIFNSTDSSYVYYDSKKIQNGVYNRERFYFKVDPYHLTNINDFNRDEIEFTGTFVSDSIFPTFRETLSINTDNSLGFYHATPKDGLSAYGKGIFTDTLHLSNSGLVGNGTLNYLASTTKSKEFVFSPEDMVAQAESFELKEQATQMFNPDVNGEKVFAEWHPHLDELFVRSTSLPLDMYKKLANLSGTLRITPQGITGKGNMELLDAELYSQYFSYEPKTILADTAVFKLKNTDGEGYAFASKDVTARIDFATRKGTFKSTSAENISEFPSNNYLCYINDFNWDMDQHLMEFGKEDRNLLASLWETNNMETLPGSSMNQFVSTSAKQDSLTFLTPLALYDVSLHTINAKYVRNLDIADARIFPENGELNIEKGGSLETFRNAKVVADTLNFYHNITNATINVHGKNSYSGTGNYIYIDQNEKEQELFFDLIDVDSLGQTYALASLPEEKSFTLSPQFDFKGKAKLLAKQKSLLFEGQTHLHNQCEYIKDNWLDFSANIDPKDILIPVPIHTTDDENLKVYNSFFLTNDSIHIYSSFLSRRIFYTDNVLLDAKGFLTFNDKLQAYQIGSKEKLKDQDAEGNLISFYQNNCNMKGEGIVDLGAELGQIKQMASGNIEHDLASDIVTLDLIYGLDFFFSEPAFKIMENAFVKASLNPSKQNADAYAKKLTAIMGRSQAEKATKEMDANGSFKTLPKELQHTLFFNNLDFIWNKDDKAYQSIGDIGIGNFNNKQINKSVKGKIELDKKRSGNRITMYLEIDKATWFFFEYYHGVLFARSSDEEFNNIIVETKEDKREFKDPLKKNPYSYILAPRSMKTKFMKRFNL